MAGKGFLWKIAGLLSFLIIGIAAVGYSLYPQTLSRWLFHEPLSNARKTPASSAELPTAPPAQILATVGAEKIYGGDLEYEYRQYPDLRGKTDPAVMLDKLINDSIILQAGAKEGKITLDAYIFNNPEKDYSRRLQKVDSVRTSFGSDELFNEWINKQAPQFPVSMAK